MLVRIRKSKWSKSLSLTISMSLFTQVFYPTAAYALTSGPSQPEVQSFTPAGTSDMVDLFSGDFHYNIPLLDVGGYPINMSYASGIGMDQEASWVGLGWNLNTGCITRNMRGLPDDFNGDLVKKEANMKKNITYGLTTGIGLELFGSDYLTGSLSYSLGISYNNYNGIGFEQSISPTIKMSDADKGTLTASLGISASSEGLDIRPSLSFSSKYQKETGNDKNLTTSIGVNFNSRAGLTATTFGMGMNRSEGYGDKIKGNENTFGQNAGGHISFVDQTYIPNYEMPRNNYSVTVSAKLSPTLLGTDAVEATISGYYTESGLAQKVDFLPAFGYFNHNQGASGSKVMMDFNREKDGGFSRSTTNLPLTNSTYDVFSISGQGVGGSFRGFRGDVGYVFDPYSSSISVGGSLGGELAAGQLVSGGVDVNVNTTTSKTSKWTEYNKMLPRVPYKKVQPGSVFEPVYYKELGEKNIDDDLLYTRLGGDYAVRNNLTPLTYDARLENTFINTFGATTSIGSELVRDQNKRVKRNNCISFLNKSEAVSYGLTGYASGYGTGFHIGEITVLRNDGARYIFGLPAYNIIQKELTFAVNGTGNCSTGLVTYTDTEASNANSSGMDNYFSSTVTPAYAHSYMLSAIVSSDYVDIDGKRGPSEGDLGSYTAFDYDANNNPSDGVQATVPQYKWRTPYSTDDHKAYYNEGLKSKNDDQKASVVYGEKEIFYVQRIHTKTHVAVFYTSARLDAHDVTGEQGGVGTNAMHKLDSIALYSLPDYKANPLTAEVIKKVHFEYDYTLCPGVPNNTNTSTDGVPVTADGKVINGKLTLKKIYFTYGKSRKGKLNAYSFNYADVDFSGTVDSDENPAYNIKGYDRWGNYKPNSTDPGCGINDDLPAAEYPYVDETESQSTLDKHAAAWSLTSIQIPSGGIIRIHYESDDYAYVQDRPAAQMVKVVGCADVPNASTLSNNLYLGSTVNDYVYFDLPVAVASEDELAQKYLKNINGGLLYFRFLTALGSNLLDGQCDYVSGYSKVIDYGLNTGSGTRAWVRLEQVKEDGPSSADAHPISKAAWQFARIHNPKLAYATFSGTSPTGGILSVLNALASASLINQIINLFEGPNGDLQNRDCGRKFVPSKSWIRLYNPNGKKHGGGARVKQIEISDEWESMTGGTGSSDYSNKSYGQKFYYDSNGDGSGTSNGVATYEPQLGGDENIFRQPVYMTTEHLLAPDDVNYVEEPFGESFFPSPSVGYSKVKVVNYNPSPGTITTNATGYTVNEFYTAKDFPTYTERTGILPVERKSGLLGTLLKLDVKNYMTATQGYMIELNDMHGKQKAQWVYQQNKPDPISGVEYKYATRTLSTAMTGPFAGMTHTRTVLDNTVIAITPSGEVEYPEVGKEYEFTVDMRQSINEVYGFSTQGNLAVFLALLFPIPVPTVFPGFNKEKTLFRSAVNTKVVNRYGILRETIAYDLGSKVSTENIAYDSQTGEVLLTKTINNFDDPIYNFTYPAHWAYEGMGQAYKNIGLTVDVDIEAGGSASVSTGYVNQTGNILLEPGDEVYISSTPTSSGAGAVVGKRAWVWDDDDDHSDVYLIDKHGALLPNADNVRLKVLRSGRRNMQTIPVGQLTLRDNPLKDTNADSKFDEFNLTPGMGRPIRLLQASATEFSEDWGTYCDIENNIATVTDNTCNCEPNMIVADFLVNAINFTINAGWPSGSIITMPASLTPDILVSLGYSPTEPVTIRNIFYYSSLETFTLSIFIDGNPCRMNPSLSSSVDFPVGIGWENLESVSFLGIEEPTDCDEESSQVIYFTGHFTGGIDLQFEILDEPFDCWKFALCDEADECGNFEGSVINPYRHNVRGTYRPKKQWLPLVDRKQEDYAVSGNHYIDIRNEGEFESFTEFWKAPVLGSNWTIDSTNWTWSNEVTKFDPYGNEIENRDALKRYSGAVYGYNNKLAIAVGSNTTFNQIAFDGFEDYDYKVISECCKEHFDFYDSKEKLVDTESHTGRYSIKLEDDESIVGTYTLTHDALTGGADDVPYTVKDRDILGYFSPNTLSEQRYVLSYWVKAENPAHAEIHSYDDVTASITLNTGSVTVHSTKKTDIIDGWQQVEIIFTIPGYSTAGADDITFTFNNATSANTAYIDDVRLHPFNSSMKSFVYDPISLRLWAELDERNFATLYEYDQEGALVRVKKETERGIMTIQESRNNTRKVFKDK